MRSRTVNIITEASPKCKIRVKSVRWFLSELFLVLRSLVRTTGEKDVSSTEARTRTETRIATIRCVELPRHNNRKLQVTPAAPSGYTSSRETTRRECLFLRVVCIVDVDDVIRGSVVRRGFLGAPTVLAWGGLRGVSRGSRHSQKWEEKAGSPPT